MYISSFSQVTIQNLNPGNRQKVIAYHIIIYKGQSLVFGRKKFQTLFDYVESKSVIANKLWTSLFCVCYRHYSLLS